MTDSPNRLRAPASALQAVAGASTAVALGDLIALTNVDQTQGASFQIAGPLVALAAWIAAIVAARPKLVGLFASFIVAVLYAVLSSDSAASFIFLGFVYPPLLIAVIEPRRLVSVGTLIPRLVLLAILGLFLGISMGFIPYPAALLVVIAPWISSRGSRAAIATNRGLSLAFACAVASMGAFSSRAVVSGTAGLFALICALAISRRPEDGDEVGQRPGRLRRPRL
ncbi:hypothetical protein GCM10012320_36210 [Sinomonas cellulolyticus]|uniref:Uncharacterized protein n=1 Tax=Sinomonas cellulolyticus TaxID=2801916 RepID=A0ABS1K5K0_9MICC|nr:MULTISPECIES: hypothetical protein [Sinomonas]MBL0706925.1 hypothetical protein [Sinomonas cellulolyticus]GHG61379.1 hypothetical protein GCM10012320_36210 [Sinomonas sp. KCTC 49339]